MQTAVQELSDLIVKGYKRSDVKESQTTYIRPRSDGGFDACAMGMAYIAFVGDPKKAATKFCYRIMFASPYEFFEMEMGIPAFYCKKVSYMHISGNTAMQIVADMKDWELPTIPERYQPSIALLPRVSPESQPKPSFIARCRAWWRRNRRPQLQLVMDNA
jgi:hypothetical protein